MFRKTSVKTSKSSIFYCESARDISTLLSSPISRTAAKDRLTKPVLKPRGDMYAIDKAKDCKCSNDEIVMIFVQTASPGALKTF